ncbi:MAG: biopolymer transporter ExbD [Sulfuritalea sp.]|nr:biopolymer transporter ExbD [Sulfuritalea sp.]MCF8183821.1 biopolymer transporter ExbD [Polynucleobacter sp.]
MNFQRGRRREELEINLIPMIDVLLVILIFLMITTTYSKFSGLEINLPTADAPQSKEQPDEISVVVTAAGEIMVNKMALGARDIETLTVAMKRLIGPGKEPIVIINADAKAAHQSVIDVMQAAQQAGLSHISFAIQRTQP